MSITDMVPEIAGSLLGILCESFLGLLGLPYKGMTNRIN